MLVGICFKFVFGCLKAKKQFLSKNEWSIGIILEFKMLNIGSLADIQKC